MDATLLHHFVPLHENEERRRGRDWSRSCLPLDSYAKKDVCAGHVKEADLAVTLGRSPDRPLTSPPSRRLTYLQLEVSGERVSEGREHGGGGQRHRSLPSHGRGRKGDTGAEHGCGTRTGNTRAAQHFAAASQHQPTRCSSRPLAAPRLRLPHAATRTLQRLCRRSWYASGRPKLRPWPQAGVRARGRGRAGRRGTRGLGTLPHARSCHVKGAASCRRLFIGAWRGGRAGACCPHAERDVSGFQDCCATFTYSRGFGTL